MRALIVDGYNVIHAWPPLQSLAQQNSLEAARNRLVAQLASYAAQSGVEVTVVFDSHSSTGPAQEQSVDGIHVRYGTAAASADHVIERLAHKATRGGLAHDIIVATSDKLQRELVIAMGVGVMTSLELYAEVSRSGESVAQRVDTGRTAARLNRRVEDQLDPEVRRRLDELRRGSQE